MGIFISKFALSPMSVFEREGQHLLSDAKISYIQALLGAEMDVETLEGSKKLKIPRGRPMGRF